jgi:hypothetical protein
MIKKASHPPLFGKAVPANKTKHVHFGRLINMNLGIDGRVITWHIGSGLATYTNNLLENLNMLKQLKNILLF